MRELVLKKCSKCGAIVKVIKDCTCSDCGIECCKEKMKNIKPNSLDASFEKHVPEYKTEGDNIIVTVNHVMDDDHFIEWICFLSNDREEFIYFNPKDEAKAIFKKSSGILYSYCNKHGLWMQKIND